MASAGIFFVILAFHLCTATAGFCPGNPGQCSQHGQCMKDTDGTYRCNCEWGWTRDDCSEKLCPHGDDPLTVGQNPWRVALVIQASSGKISGTLIITFNGFSIEMGANGNEVTSEECTASFRRLYNLHEVSCQRISVDAQRGARYEISIASFSTKPVMNNLYYHDGSPSLAGLSCNATQTTDASDVSCRFESMENFNVKEYLPCSNHGRCDPETGRCVCDLGFKGEDCSNNKDNEDILTGISDGPFFTGNLARLSSRKGPSTEFNFIHAQASSYVIFTINGMGDTTLHRGQLILESEGQVIRNGGLEVAKGIFVEKIGLYIKNGEATVKSSSETKTLVSVLATSTKYSGSMVELNLSPQDLDAKCSFLSAKVGDDVMLVLKNDRKNPLVVRGINVTSGGVKVFEGGIDIMSGGHIVRKDGIHIEHGGLHVNDSGIIVNDGGLLVKNGGTILRNSVNLQSVLTLESSIASDSPILHIKADHKVQPIHGSSIVNISAGGRTLLDVMDSGSTTIHSGGLNITTGGLRVNSGGIFLDSGGLIVKSGGIKVESGGFVIRNEGFEVAEGGLKVTNTASNGPVLSMNASNPQFLGKALKVHVNRMKGSDFTFMEALALDEVMLSLRGDGTIDTKGDLITSGNGRIVSSGDLIAQTRAIFKYTHVKAGKTIAVPSTHSYARILDDGEHNENFLSLNKADALTGQLIVIQNDDEDPTRGIRVPAHSSILLIYDGKEWREMTSSSFETAKLTGVTEFKAISDLNIGDVKVMLKDLEVGSQKPGHIAFYGKGGLLSGESDLTYSNGKLKVSAIEMSHFIGSVNMSASELINVTISTGSILNVDVNAYQISSKGEIHCASNAFVGGSLTVNGHVMGSGSYIDSSDQRFKQDIQPLKYALQTIRALRGVTYSFRRDEFPEKKFPNGKEIGFVAQEIEKHIPSVVYNDSKGFKYISYAKFAPVLVEGIKELDHQRINDRKEVQDEISQLDMKISKLSEIIDKYQQKVEEMMKLLDQCMQRTTKDYSSINMK